MSFFSKIILKIIRSEGLKTIKNHPKSEVGRSISIGNYCNWNISPAASKIIFCDNINIRNYCNIYIGKDASLHLGKNFFMNNYCSINVLENIEIGENTLFGEGVKLYDHNHQYSTSPIFTVEHQKFNSKKIKIGKNCWLGSNVTVLKGVTIGDNCIIGAGCLIYKDIPDNSIVKNKTDLIIDRT